MLLAAHLLLGACSMVASSHYDGKTDRALTKLHEQTAEFFVGAANPIDCEHNHYLDFYQQSRVAVSGLQVRAKAMADNRFTVEQLQLLASSYEGLEQLHRLGCFSEAQVEDLWAVFDAGFSAVLRLELAKKHGRG